MKVLDGLHAFIWNDYSQNNCNTYLITGEKNILIDPGHAHLADHVFRGITSAGLTPDSIDVIIATHCHPDHIEAAAKFDSMLAMSRTEYEFLSRYVNTPEPDFFIKPGDLMIGDTHLVIIDTPGHSPGSISIYWPAKKVLFPGDLVFPDGVGRTDLPGGDPALLKQSIKKVSTLDIEYLLSGHGDIVSGKDNVTGNFARIEDYWFRFL